MYLLKERVAVITGGARGIGRATAERFAAAGARVIVWDIQPPAEDASPILFDRVDVRDEATVMGAAARVHDTSGRIDILVNNAGITRDARLEKMSPEAFRHVLDVNVTGVFNCTRAVAGYMRQAGYGRVINAASIVARYGNFGQSNYVASKCAVEGMTRVWARELGPDGITVNAIAPGFIATDMIATVPEKIIESVKSRTPLRRLGDPAEVAEGYLFLASDAASFINGHVLHIDGGLTI